MLLQQSEGYLIALQDIKKMIEEKIQECEYALGECYTNMHRDAYPDAYKDSN